MSHYFNPETEGWKPEREQQLQIALSKIDDIIFQNKKNRKPTVEEMEEALKKIDDSAQHALSYEARKLYYEKYQKN